MAKVIEFYIPGPLVEASKVATPKGARESHRVPSRDSEVCLKFEAMSGSS